ncbi:RNA-directed RNA polymerase [Hymenopellis radicata]|nr:RNA-directed RNA polymerase [Hymenopellis radicata]
MAPRILRSEIAKDDDSWVFQLPPNELVSRREGYGKFLRFSGPRILFEFSKFSNNRVLQTDDPRSFVQVSFALPRFPDWTPKEGSEYMSRFFKAGLFLNGVQYRFYHHSASQLRSRSCFLREATADQELDDRIYRMGTFGNIMEVAKHEVFSDGCGLMSRALATYVSKRKKIIFRGVRYTPSVFQIRYLGYKGVLMLHPKMDRENELRRRKATEAQPTEGPCLAQFRRSMKKFSTTQNPTFSVVGYSKPYSFGRLNNEIIVLLSSLGVPNENFIALQQEYFDWITQAELDPLIAVNFLSSMGKYETAERVLLDGIEEPHVLKAIHAAQKAEIAGFQKEGTGKHRSRMFVKKSRKIYGVCDPFRVLKEGQVHVRITSARGGPSTLISGDVLVVRNPCLNPGDCLKLRAVNHPDLAHLVDCVVFASVAKPGHHSAPSMSSGGDLDGDEYFVCWEPRLVPSTVSEPYDYPPNKLRVNKSVTRMDLANHFASYNNGGVARATRLHNQWAMASPRGALCSECQELSALHSQSVDGAPIKIPDRLTTPPSRPESDPPYIIDVLTTRAIEFATQFTARSLTDLEGISSMDEDDAPAIIQRLLQSQQSALSEYELFTMAYRIALRHGLDHRSFFNHINCGALTTAQKYSVSFALNLSLHEHASLWNSLLRSDILSRADLYERSLTQPFSLHRLYSSKDQGMPAFFGYLRMAIQDFTRKVLILKTDDRFVLAIFIRGEIPWDEDAEVDENVVVCAFLPQSTSSFSTYRPCSVGYRLYCSSSILQLYNKQRSDSFVFITVPPSASGADVAISVALQKISNKVRQNIGRVNRQAINAIELHVVSNRDTVAHQLFDLWFEHIPTETRVRRFDREVRTYKMNNIEDVEWEGDEETRPASFLRTLFEKGLKRHEFMQCLPDIIASHWVRIMAFALHYHREDEVFWLFDFVISQPLPLRRESVMVLMGMHPPLVYALLKKYVPDPDEKTMAPELAGLEGPILENVIRSANDFPLPTLVALEKLSSTIANLEVHAYVDLLGLATLATRSFQLVQEVLFVLNDCRSTRPEIPPALRYLHKNALGVAFERAEEAADECPCNDDGRPRKQRTPPVKTTLRAAPNKPSNFAKAVLRVDAKTPIRIHSHVRLQSASPVEFNPSNKGGTESIILDAEVVESSKGELTLRTIHPLPPEFEVMDWTMYHAGSLATSDAMMDALQRLLTEKQECCEYYHLLVGEQIEEAEPRSRSSSPVPFEYGPNLNDSQMRAIDACNSTVSLIWGPPGTGKTTVVVQILRKLVQAQPNTRILMTASTHNAVDNVLERFIRENRTHSMLSEDQILRVATDVSKVNKDLLSYTVDARIGGDVNERLRNLQKRAKERVEAASLVFTTCAGAGLGLLRDQSNFDVALIDEASQVTEPCALIPLVKGARRAILVGDHVQLRPTVKNVGKALQSDVSLMERLYRGDDAPGISKTMLDTQYRFPQELAAFPSREFYEGKLKSGLRDTDAALRTLSDGNTFPWPKSNTGVPFPCVFVQCSDEEDMGGLSKCNTGQVEVVAKIVKLLRSGVKDLSPEKVLSITNLSPYTKQIQELRHRLSDIPSFTIDSFQGRESDIIIFSSVRSNAQRDIGFLEDERRLNVMWTRARKALVIIGDRQTMDSNQLWKRALEACMEVTLPEEAS